MKVIPTDHAPQAPQGSKFYVDKCDFRAGRSINVAQIDLDEGRLYDWPMVYILTNEHEAYVGQTTSVIRRMSQHGANPQKAAFTTANIIYNAEANMSVITDYESRLIQLMSADGKYQLTNRNEGIADSNYYSKAEYDAMFEDLWSELRLMDLANKTIAELEESEVFKYSPYKNLNPEQRDAAWKIMAAIKDALADPSKARPIVVKGMPGTGKTILAIYLLKLLKDDPELAGRNIRILEPVPPLQATLQSAVKGVMNLTENDVMGPADLVKPQFTNGVAQKPFDIVLVDEAHRLKQRKNIVAYKAFDDTSRRLGFDPRQVTQLDWVLKQTKIPILFFDDLQVVGPSGINASVMTDRLGEAFAHPLVLEEQMRVKSGRAYLDYLSDILWNRRPQRRTFEGYELAFHEDFADFHQSFENRLRTNDLTRMIAGFAWPWASKRDKSVMDIQIGGIQIQWNTTQSNWVGKGMDDPRVAREMGVIHTIQGYDLSYAYVVIGPDLTYDAVRDRITVDRNSYYDTNGKNTATDEELEEYIRHIYYVLLTRGIYGTHVYVCDPALRAHLRQFFG